MNFSNNRISLPLINFKNMFDSAHLKDRMQKSLDVFTKHLSSVRTGRASASFLDPVKVVAYGNTVPLNQVASITISDASTLTVSVWDNSLAATVEKAILEGNLGVNPAREGNSIRVTLPKLTQERRKELCKLVRSYCEDSKVTIRNVRRDELDDYKKMEKNKEISEDELKKISSQIQDITDKFVNNIDSMTAEKEKELLTD